MRRHEPAGPLRSRSHRAGPPARRYALARRKPLASGSAGGWVLPYFLWPALWVVVAIGVRCGMAGAVDFRDQHRVWKHTSSALNDTYLKASYVDKNHPDTSFNHDNDNDFFLYAAGDGNTWWNQAILIDFGWDSLYGYGPIKIPNPAQVDSCTIDSGWIWVQVPSWDYSDVVNITAYRTYTDFDYDGSEKLYPSWNHPRSGQNWVSGTTFSRSDLVGEDSSNVAINVQQTYIRVPVAGMFNDFTDSTGRRTGICLGVKFAHPDHDSTACFYTESAIAGSTIMYLELWWSEYGVKSVVADSQKVLTKDTEIQVYFDPILEIDYSCYNYGAATQLQTGTNTATSVENGRLLVDPFGLTDSLDDNVEIDSARYCFYVDAKTGASLAVHCFKTVRWWVEGAGVGGGVFCGADYYHSRHATGGECATYYGWTTAGCGGTTDRESVAFDTVAADTGWNYFWVPDSIATGMYNDRDKANASRTNFTGVLLKMATETGNRLRVRSQNYTGTNYDPYWIFYFQNESAPSGQRRHPASLEEIICQGAYLK